MYRDYSKFNEEIFRENLKESFTSKDTHEHDVLEGIFLSVLNAHASIKNMTKQLRKAIMKRSRLENKYYKSKCLEDKTSFKKQRNYCNRLYKKEKRKFRNNLNLNEITDYKHFTGKQ